MPSLTPYEVVVAATTGGYAIGAFNAVNLETAQAVVLAAEEQRAPVFLQVSQNAARHGGMAPLLAAARELRQAASVPVILHFDHAEDLGTALEALELGCDSVMLESGPNDLVAYVATLRKLVAAAHARGAIVEGEFDVVEKGARESSSHDPTLIAELAAEAGCDLVAIDAGTRHKAADRNLSLDFSRLEAVARVVPRPLVLHGASSVPVSELTRAAGLGVAKVNVATELMNEFTAAVRAVLDAEQRPDPRSYLGSGRSAMALRAGSLIRALGSAGRAG